MGFNLELFFEELSELSLGILRQLEAGDMETVRNRAIELEEIISFNKQYAKECGVIK